MDDRKSEQKCAVNRETFALPAEFVHFIHKEKMALPAVRDLTHDGCWNMFDENVLKLLKVSFWGVIRTLQSNINTLPSPSAASHYYFNSLYLTRFGAYKIARPPQNKKPIGGEGASGS
jgi:hypothetical protein